MTFKKEEFKFPDEDGVSNESDNDSLDIEIEDDTPKKTKAASHPTPSL